MAKINLYYNNYNYIIAKIKLPYKITDILVSTVTGIRMQIIIKLKFVMSYETDKAITCAICDFFPNTLQKWNC